MLDDEDSNPGVKFTNMDLIGIPHRLIVSEKNIRNNSIEYHTRIKNEKKLLNLQNIISEIMNIFSKKNKS